MKFAYLRILHKANPVWKHCFEIICMWQQKCPIANEFLTLELLDLKFIKKKQPIK